MSKDKIGVGIVGLSAQGGWAALSHVPALRYLSDDFEIVGLTASSMESAKASAEKHGVAFYTDSPAELAARPEVDLVVITVKVPYHKELVEAALDAGKMVYCEWPLAKDLKEAEELAELAFDKGVRNFVGLQARSAPPVRFLRDLIAEGRIGKVISTTVVGSGGPPWGGACPSANAYATDRTTGANMLTIPFGHTIDALSWILGDFDKLASTLSIRRRQVSLTDTGGTATASAPDQVAISGILEGGAVASMHYRGGMSRGTNFLWEINGTEGDIVVTGGIGHLQFGLIKIQIATGSDTALTELQVPDSYHKVKGAAPTVPNYAVAHAYRNLLEDILSNSNNLPDFAEAVQLHRLLADIEYKAGF